MGEPGAFARDLCRASLARRRARPPHRSGEGPASARLASPAGGRASLDLARPSSASGGRPCWPAGVLAGVGRLAYAEAGEGEPLADAGRGSPSLASEGAINDLENILHRRGRG
ncbi:hypothetical protein NL676_036141 [Syzygium grande]|nr:hypothetical protein NL676_036141 [Syzygium grande]